MCSSGLCISGTVRLLLDGSDAFYGDNDVSAAYLYKDELTRGRVEICIDQEFIPICDDSWKLEAASVVCRQLGFSPYGNDGVRLLDWLYLYHIIPFCTVGAIADRSGLFHSEGETVLTWSELNCTGTEMVVKDCLVLASKDCLSDEAASVICQGM